MNVDWSCRARQGGVGLLVLISPVFFSGFSGSQARMEAAARPCVAYGIC